VACVVFGEPRWLSERPNSPEQGQISGRLSGPIPKVSLSVVPRARRSGVISTALSERARSLLSGKRTGNSFFCSAPHSGRQRCHPLAPKRQSPRHGVGAI
jgi:hypothetical protein